MTASAQSHELRSYPPAIMVAVTVEADFDAARAEAGRLLMRLDGERVVVKPATMIQFRGADVMVEGDPFAGGVWTIGVVVEDAGDVPEGARVFGLRGYEVAAAQGLGGEVEARLRAELAAAGVAFEGVPEVVLEDSEWGVQFRVK